MNLRLSAGACETWLSAPRQSDDSCQPFSGFHFSDDAHFVCYAESYQVCETFARTDSRKRDTCIAQADDVVAKAISEAPRADLLARLAGVDDAPEGVSKRSAVRLRKGIEQDLPIECRKFRMANVYNLPADVFCAGLQAMFRAGGVQIALAQIAEWETRE